MLKFACGQTGAVSLEKAAEVAQALIDAFGFPNNGDLVICQPHNARFILRYGEGLAGLIDGVHYRLRNPNPIMIVAA